MPAECFYFWLSTLKPKKPLKNQRKQISNLKTIGFFHLCRLMHVLSIIANAMASIKVCDCES